jgi:DNA-binding transcriptional LysR family regulator
MILGAVDVMAASRAMRFADGYRLCVIQSNLISWRSINKEFQSMRVTIAQLEAVYWVAYLGSVHRAARKLNVSQPTVSLRLRDLERSLGRKLFQKAGRGIRATNSGLQIAERARAIFDELGSIGGQYEPEAVTGPIRLGVAEGVAMVCVAPLMEKLRVDYPALRPELFVATSATLERDMMANRLEIAVLVNPVGQPGLRLQPLGAQPNQWIAHPDYGLGPVIRPADLRSVPIITNPAPSAMFRQIIDWFATARIEPLRLDMCTSVTLVAHLVGAGVGVGLLPTKMIEVQLAAGVIVALPSDPPLAPGQVYAAIWENGETVAVKAVMRALTEVLSGLDYLIHVQ